MQSDERHHEDSPLDSPFGIQGTTAPRSRPRESMVPRSDLVDTMRGVGVADCANNLLPVVRMFLARHGSEYGITVNLIAEHLLIPSSALSGVGTPARWLPITLAGLAISLGIPTDELGWLFEWKASEPLR